MTRRRRPRWTIRVAGALGASVFLLACTLTQSLDYLTKGDGLSEGGTTGEGGSEDDPLKPETGAPNQLVGSQTKPDLLAQDDATLYWTSATGVYAMPKSNGKPKMLSGPVAASSLVADVASGPSLFLTVGFGILRVAKDGSGSGTVFTPEPDGGPPPASFVASDPSYLYLLQNPAGADSTYIKRMARDGGGPADLAGDTAPETLTLGSQNVIWYDSAGGTNGAFYTLPRTAPLGTTPSTLALGPSDTGPVSSAAITSDDTTIYWATDSTSTKVGVYSLAMTATAQVITLYLGKDADSFGGVASDATNLYVLDTQGGSIVRVPKAGGNPTVLQTGLVTPHNLVVDATNVYATVEGVSSKGYILEIPK